ncbi:MAG: leucine-rich repeat domain-containing protein [Paludibacteraceae bacterium]|nr:leucine-rich repeat domain-containing protein [Paludibacteraceae bacterium]
MKRYFLILAVCCVALGMPAQQFESNGLWYELTGKRTAQVISDPTDSVYRAYTEVVVPETVRYEGRDYQVTRLDDQAFRYCHFLKEVSLPEGLREMGFQAFMNCTQLREIRLPGTLRWIDDMAFYGCASLETVYVGKRVKRWPDMCFSDCERLKQIYHAGRRPPKSHKMSFFNCPKNITYYRLK